MLRSRWIAALLALACSLPAAAVDVIVHPAQPEREVSRSLARGLFGMRVRAWPSGEPVQVFVLDDGAPLHDEFCKTVLQMYPYQLRQNWDRLLYSGTGQPPVMVASEEELLARVAATPGAIGYVRQFRPPAAPVATATQGKGKNSPKNTPPAPPAPVKVLHVR